jgi:hypothetical protein
MSRATESKETVLMNRETGTDDRNKPALMIAISTNTNVDVALQRVRWPQPALLHCCRAC